MNTLNKTAALAILAFLLLSCNGLSGCKETDETTTPVKTAVDQVEPKDSVLTVEGVVVDGSRRNAIIDVNGEEQSFDLPYDTEVTYNIGDTLVIKYIPTDLGDSVVEATNKHPQD